MAEQMRPQIAHVMHAAHRRLKRDGTIDVELDSLEQLLNSDGRDESGVDSLVAILDSSLRLPTSLVVRIALPRGGGMREPDVVAFHGHCQVEANNAWREAMTLRHGGIRELPRALSLSVAAAALGVVAGYFAQGTDNTLLMVLLYAIAFIGVIAAWTIGWTPIEQALFDWRAPGHTAAVYELLSRARVEVVERPREPGSSHSVIGRA